MSVCAVLRQTTFVVLNLLLTNTQFERTLCIHWVCDSSSSYNGANFGGNQLQVCSLSLVFVQRDAHRKKFAVHWGWWSGWKQAQLGIKLKPRTYEEKNNQCGFTFISRNAAIAHLHTTHTHNGAKYSSNEIFDWSPVPINPFPFFCHSKKGHIFRSRSVLSLLYV